jgi:hypothetical protein
VAVPRPSDSDQAEECRDSDGAPAGVSEPGIDSFDFNVPASQGPGPGPAATDSDSGADSESESRHESDSDRRRHGAARWSPPAASLAGDGASVSSAGPGPLSGACRPPAGPGPGTGNHGERAVGRAPPAGSARGQAAAARTASVTSAP